jgi:hypothetical protein
MANYPHPFLMAQAKWMRPCAALRQYANNTEFSRETPTRRKPKWGQLTHLSN